MVARAFLIILGDHRITNEVWVCFEIWPCMKKLKTNHLLDQFPIPNYQSLPNEKNKYLPFIYIHHNVPTMTWLCTGPTFSLNQGNLSIKLNVPTKTNPSIGVLTCKFLMRSFLQNYGTRIKTMLEIQNMGIKGLIGIIDRSKKKKSIHYVWNKYSFQE